MGWKERLATCLQDARASRETVVAKFLPGVFTEAAAQNLRDAFAAIVAEFHPTGLRLMSLSSAEVDTTALLPRVRVPTLLIWGREDQRSPVSVAEQFHASIPASELAIIPNAGHLSNMEKPDSFNQHVRRFCLSA